MIVNKTNKTHHRVNANANAATAAHIRGRTQENINSNNDDSQRHVVTNN